MADPRLVIRVESSAPTAAYISFGPAEENQILPDGRTAFVIPIFVTVHLEELSFMDEGAVMIMSRSQTDLPLPRIGNEPARLEEYEEEEEASSSENTSTKGNNATSAESLVNEITQNLGELNVQEEMVNHLGCGYLEDRELAIAPSEPMPMPTSVMMEKPRNLLMEDPVYEIIRQNDKYMLEIRGYKNEYTNYRKARAWEEELMQTNLQEFGRKARRTFYKKLEAAREKLDKSWEKINDMVQKFRRDFPPYLEKYYRLPPLPAHK